MDKDKKKYYKVEDCEDIADYYVRMSEGRTMDNNDPQNDWIDNVVEPKTDENEKFEKFYIKWKKRIFNDENPDNASVDAPEGFHKWLKSNKGTVK